MNRLIYLLALTCLVAGSNAALALNNGRYKIVVSSTGQNMDVSGASTADGATVVQYPARTVDGTHFQENGARVLARFVAEGIGEAALPLNSHRR
ncbi:MAG: RICIN domain-containing protein [Steroidobacteraceae bacterium]